MRQKFRYIPAILMSLIGFHCDSSQEWVNIARQKHSQGNIAEALYYYDLALRKNPDNATANRNMGILLAESGQAPGSSSLYLEKALTKDPQNPDILLYLLEIYLSAGSRTEADKVLSAFSKGWDKDRESLAKFLKECLLEGKKNPTERKRFQENRIPDANPASKRMFRECEERMYSDPSSK
ncbi:tetratricopeptide repeat protein [Leptospira fletcheri]|uniref:Tetratricopeptide repeat protein n=1 Tax=Leptospira fletcheri TaxID=2484981 RepID=A0A4R9G493_9LEPT|nr:tetratricopeptide repeat protein [Leptospira fletcheri]TGK06214.1 tetratricopeptide repeat protein [Leptospira fletcheri]